jgi:7-cyano-7-deazaguanine synthase in queuosine biosynthesis
MTLPWPRNRTLPRALAAAIAQAPGLTATAAKRPLRCIVMLSGGLDSVALLANLLSATPHHVHAHHIEIDNFERRALPENDALARVLSYLRVHHRAFDYSASASSFPIGKGGGYDLTLSLFVAARLCTALGGNIDAVFTGHRDTNFKILSEGAAVFHACFIQKRTHPQWVRPLASMPKGDIAASIPPALARLSWSCRKPRDLDPPPPAPAPAYAPCGVCHACRELATLTPQP